MKIFFQFVICSLIFWNNMPEVFSQDNPKIVSKQVVIPNKTLKNSPAPFSDNDHTRKIVKQTQIEREARKLIKNGKYQKALEKAIEAVAMNAEMAGYGSGVAHFLMREALWLQRWYEEALKDVTALLEINKGQQSYIDEKLELEALIKARNTNNSQPIYAHIEYLKKKYKDALPPKKIMAGFTNTLACTIARLYDHIGDMIAGAAFMEGFLKFYKKIGPGDPYQPANPYFQIKQAFEQDKAEGFKGCLDAKPGDACMGRATKALIQSDYFPW